MFNWLKNIFSSKKDHDVKGVRPLVAQINEEYEKLRNLSDDELRGKTAEFRAEIQDYIAEIVNEMKEVQAQAEGEANIELKTTLYERIDALKKERNKAVEDVLMQLLPQAFAVVKETSRRLTENKELRVKATDWDRAIAAARPDIAMIEGDMAIWDNKWMVTTTEIEWNMVHYDVQLIGGIILHQGKISEMATGEGKTLVATLPVYLNALTGMGLHVVTVNNYLAQRDCEWNGPLFQFHGLSIDCIDGHEPNSTERRNAYLADITYGTNNEFGFDYLRDNMTSRPEFLVQRDHHFAIIDEVDSILVDEARTPLIISGPVTRGGDIQQYMLLKPRIERVVKKQKELVNKFLIEAKKLIEAKDTKNGGIALLRAYRGLPKSSALIRYLSEPGIKAILNKTEGEYMQDNSKRMPEIDEPLCFTIDEKNNTIEMTDIGRDIITAAGEDPHLFVIPDVGARFHEISLMNVSEEQKQHLKDELSKEYGQKSELLHAIQQLLKAYTLFEKDIAYIIQEEKVMIVDEQTGRVLSGRRYSDGLHQAIEAKENVKVEAATQTFATITLQNYFRMFHKLAGMTGTAETEESEFFEIYKLDVVVIPTNRPISRKDDDDMIYKTKRAKYNAVIDEIVKLSTAGRPVLVGTTSVEVSELLSRMLKMRGIEHNVLNAKQHLREAEIVQEAGMAGKVTIATNMAGRGTDIKLGVGVKEAGGLAIIGTERHESRRVDRQLRGRAGRQGDPGSSQFFISLEDDLMRLFSNVERVSSIMDRFGFKEDDVIQHPTITKQISAAQKKVEENNFAMRKRLLEYDDVMNSQREVVYRRRRNALYGDRIKIDLDNMLADMSRSMVEKYYDGADAEGLQMDCIRTFGMDPEITELDLNKKDLDAVADEMYENVKAYYNRKSDFLANMLVEGIQNMVTQNPQIQQIVIPFTDGVHGTELLVSVNDVLASKGKVIIDEMEKTVMLSIIDDKWKNHLRDMDELRQSVQNAVFEQKDPLLVYKFEAFQLFQHELNTINTDVLAMLMKYDLQRGETPEQAAPAQVQRQVEQQRKKEFSGMKTQHEDVEEELRKRKEEQRNILAGSGNDSVEDNRVLSRRERRDMDKKKKK